MPAIEIHTTRFGSITIEPEDVLFFPCGLWGLEDCVRWVLLTDAQNAALAWLQCTTRPEVALAVVSPRRFVPSYQARIGRTELELVAAEAEDDVHLLAIVSKNDEAITLNLKAPLVVNLRSRLGRQVISGGDQPLQYALHHEPVTRMKVA